MPAVETTAVPAAPSAPAAATPVPAVATPSAPPVPAAQTAPVSTPAVDKAAPASPAPAASTEPAKTNAPAADAAPKSLLADEPVATTGEAAPADAPKPTGEAAPVAEFKIEAPKDSPLATTTVEKLTAWAKEAKIPQAEAQKLVEALHAESVASVAAAKAKQTADYTKLYDTWGDELRKDAEVGGEKLKDSLAQAKRSLRVFATPEERAFLESTPFGNHPVLVKILARAGAKLSEDGFIGGGTNPAPPKTPAQVAYGSDHTKPSSFR